MLRWGQTDFSDEGMTHARSAFRPDLYLTALGPDAALPDEASEKGAGGYEGFMDGKHFDPDAVQAYVDGFPVRSSFSPSHPITDS